jgi:hypothetical protein
MMQIKPDHVNPAFNGGCLGCPSDFFPAATKPCLTDQASCTACWDRETEDTAPKLSRSSEPDTTDANVARHRRICERLNDLYRRKNHDYGDSFHQSYLEDGLLMTKIRLGDKYSRFKKLIASEQTVKDESIEDTLIDLANYAIMTVMELERERGDRK